LNFYFASKCACLAAMLDSISGHVLVACCLLPVVTVVLYTMSLVFHFFLKWACVPGPTCSRNCLTLYIVHACHSWRSCTVFLVKRLWSLSGQTEQVCQSGWENCALLVLTFLLKGGFNRMMLHALHISAWLLCCFLHIA
jgi:hypothetical protein